jgi:Tol biopolymer transport system component
MVTHHVPIDATQQPGYRPEFPVAKAPVFCKILRMRFLAGWMLIAACAVARGEIGVFEGHGNIGPGTVGGSGFDYNDATKTYVIKGTGSNMWFNADAFHFVWKKISGDVNLAADIEIPDSPGGDPHRKAVLMVRQDLDADSAYADAALHGDGLTSLQYRETKAARTYEIQANSKKPRRLRIEKHGKYVSMSIAPEGGELEPAGGSFRLVLQDPFYVGIGVCAHNGARVETATFTKVSLDTKIAHGTNLWSTLEIVPIASKDRRVVYTTRGRIEAPNWMLDSTNLIFNAQGKIHRIPITGGIPITIDTGFAIRCNNDHGISPDGKWLMISDQSQGDRKSRIYTLPINGIDASIPGGAEPKRITPNAPSYWHGISPDGKTLAFCGERNGEFDIYTTTGEGETRLTTAKGLDDGPDYTPDGKWIYYNSDRTGQMQVWRMKPDGSAQEQITNDEFNNWFPHPSPDGKWLVFLSYDKEVKGHPEDKDVTLRIMPLNGGKIETLAKLFGGQGTINVPSWSPDSKRIAFVSYQRR